MIEPTLDFLTTHLMFVVYVKKDEKTLKLIRPCCLANHACLTTMRGASTLRGALIVGNWTILLIIAKENKM